MVVPVRDGCVAARGLLHSSQSVGGFSDGGRMIGNARFGTRLRGLLARARHIVAAAIATAVLAAACTPMPAPMAPPGDDEPLERRWLSIHVAGTTDSVEYEHLGPNPARNGRMRRQGRGRLFQTYYHSCMYSAYTGQRYRVSARNLSARGRVEVHLVEIFKDPPHGRRLIDWAIDSSAHGEATIEGVLE
jgi:hypothetical protein